MYFIPTVTLTLQVFGELKFTEEEVLEKLQKFVWWEQCGQKKKTATGIRYLGEQPGKPENGFNQRNFGVDHLYEISYRLRLCDRFGQTKAFRKFVENMLHICSLGKLPGVVLISCRLRLESENISTETEQTLQLYGAYKYLQAQNQ